MPCYEYQAVTLEGRKQKGVLEASDESALIVMLKEKGLTPLDIKISKRQSPFIKRKITKRDLLTFTQELGDLLESGLPLDRAISVISEHAGKEQLREMVREIFSDVQRGQSLSQALSKHKVFPKLYVNMVKAGEAGGVIETVIRRIAIFLDTVIALRDEVISALIYPVILMVAGSAAVAILMFYVVPKFAELFQDVGQSLPLPTLILMSISSWFLSYSWLIAGILIALIVLIKTYGSTFKGRLFMDGLKLKMPIVKNLHLKFIIAQFARTLGTLLQSGVPVLYAIRVSREAIGNEVISERLMGLEEGVKKGKGVFIPTRECKVFPALVEQMIAVGEEAGRLEETFLLIAERFEKESRAHIKRTLSLLEPAMILLMGLIVGFVVISMLIAVFSINEVPL